jgi:hypothetical protein
MGLCYCNAVCFLGSKDQIRKWARDFSLLTKVQKGSGAHPDPDQWVPGFIYLFYFILFFCRGKAAANLSQPFHLNLVPRLRASGTVHPVPLYDFIAWTGVTLRL